MELWFKRFLNKLGEVFKKKPKSLPCEAVCKVAYGVSSGTDLRVFFNGESISSAHCISFNGGSSQGSITMILFSDTEYWKYSNASGSLVVFTLNETGQKMILFDDLIIFDKHGSFNASIDDIVIEMNLGFVLANKEKVIA